MEIEQSWVQPLHSTLASSELRDIYEVYNRGEKIGFQTQEVEVVLVVLTIYY